MNMKFIGASTVAAMLMTAVPAVAATVIFDDFNTVQLAVDTPYSGSSNSSTIAFRSGTRTLTAENTSNNGNAVSATTLESISGALSFSNADKATGKGTLTYTNVGDISGGSNPFFFFNVGVFDAIADFSVTATDALGNISTYAEQLAPGFNPTLFFSEFTGGADFNNLATLSFIIDSTGTGARVDGSITSISISAVPLPATGLLLFGALGGAAALRRRKARKAA